MTFHGFAKGTSDGTLEYWFIAALKLPGEAIEGREGRIQPADPAPDDGVFRPLLLAFRPLQIDVDMPFGEYRLVNEHAVVDNGHYLKLERTASKRRRTVVEDYWVDPTRDDIVVHWARRWRNESPSWVSLEYRKHRDCGWVPIRWHADLIPSRYGEEEMLRTAYSEATAGITRVSTTEDAGKMAAECPKARSHNSRSIRHPRQERSAPIFRRAQLSGIGGQGKSMSLPRTV